MCADISMCYVICGVFQVEVGRYMSRSLISVVHIFEGCNDNFLDSLSILLHEVRSNCY